MGPANRTMASGRGDKNQAAESVLNDLILNELEELRQKFEKLEKDEVNDL